MSRFGGVYGVVISWDGHRGSDTTELSEKVKTNSYVGNINRRR
jgi:hypothetical protein